VGMGILAPLTVFHWRSAWAVFAGESNPRKNAIVRVAVTIRITWDIVLLQNS